MKKITILVFLLISLFSFSNTYATDACDKLIEKQQNFVGKITSAVNVRSYPCTYKSYIKKVAKNGEEYNVVAKVDGYYKIDLGNNSYGRVWEKLVTKTSETFSNNYVLNSKDKILIKKIVKLIKLKTQKEGVIFKNNFVIKIEKLLKKVPKGKRVNILLKQLLKEIKEIKTEKEEIIKIQEEKKVTVKNNTIIKNNIFNVDNHSLKNTWISWHNNERNKLGLDNYLYDSRLDNTAFEWSNIQKNKGSMDHKRFSYSGYYDYNDIEKWFNDRGVNCKIKNRTTSSESIGYHSYYCNDNDCTSKAKTALKGIFDMYMAEKGKPRSENAHYRAITHSDITKMGFGVAIDKIGNNYYKLYVTTHYCTEFKS